MPKTAINPGIRQRVLDALTDNYSGYGMITSRVKGSATYEAVKRELGVLVSRGDAQVSRGSMGNEWRAAPHVIAERVRKANVEIDARYRELLIAHINGTHRLIWSNVTLKTLAAWAGVDVDAAGLVFVDDNKDDACGAAYLVLSTLCGMLLPKELLALEPQPVGATDPKAGKRKPPLYTWFAFGGTHGHATSLDALKAARDAIDFEIRLCEDAKSRVPTELRFKIVQQPGCGTFSAYHKIGTKTSPA